MNLQEQLQLCLPLNKEISNYITENCENDCAKWSNGRQKKLVFHFNSKFAEELNEGKLDLAIIDNFVQLTDVVILEVDQETILADKLMHVQIYSRYLLEIAVASDKEIRLCVFVDPLTDSALTVSWIKENDFA